jgi:hypothetical protein
MRPRSEDTEISSDCSSTSRTRAFFAPRHSDSSARGDGPAAPAPNDGYRYGGQPGHVVKRPSTGSRHRCRSCSISRSHAGQPTSSPSSGWVASAYGRPSPPQRRQVCGRWLGSAGNNWSCVKRTTVPPRAPSIGQPARCTVPVHRTPSGRSALPHFAICSRSAQTNPPFSSIKFMYTILVCDAHLSTAGSPPRVASPIGPCQIHVFRVSYGAARRFASQLTSREFVARTARRH